MKHKNHIEDFGALSEKGWQDLASRLDVQMPTPKRSGLSLFQKSIVASLLLLVGVLAYGLFRPAPVHPTSPVLAPIINKISFKVDVPDVTISPLVGNLDSPVAPKHPKRLVDTKLKESSPTSSAHLNLNPKEVLTKSLFVKPYLYRNHKVTIGLPSHDMHIIPTVASSLPANVSLTIKEKIPERHVRLGVNVSASTRGLVSGVGAGSGISVIFPIGKWFSVEPGVGYGLMKLNSPEAPKQPQEDFFYRRSFVAIPDLTVAYRVRQFIEMPVSFHFQPIRQIALTGGVDVGLLVSQEMVFETGKQPYNAFSNFKKQKSDNEFSQLNRLNFAAHGGVSWFPTNTWKLGVYYGQNLTKESEVKHSKLKFSNHIFKVRLARYF